MSVRLTIFFFLFVAACSRQTEVEDPEAEPSDWAYVQRTFPTGKWNPQAYLDAYKQVDRLAVASKRGSALGNWEQAGPTNIGGRISDIEFDPQHPEIVYAGAATGGVFKSTDGGNTWESVFDGYAVVNVGDIGISESDPDVLYVGTGEANGGANNIQGRGIFKSTDGGESWTPAGLENSAAIGRIVVHPTNPDLVYVAAVGSYFDLGGDRGVYRSADGGQSWGRVLALSDSTGAIDLVMNHQNPQVLYATMWQRLRRPDSAVLEGQESGLYRSRDGGDTWEELGAANGLPDPNSVDVGRIGLAISRDHPNVVFAHYTDGYEHLGVFKTSDGGDSWIDFDPRDEVSRLFEGSSGAFSWFFSQVRVSPSDTNSVYVMDVEFAHTRDGGATWIFNAGTSVLHVDHHALAFHPTNPEYIVEGNDGGINISENGGASWREVHGLPVTQFYEVAIDPHFPDQIYGGSQDNQNVWTNTGSLDDWSTLQLGFGGGGDGFDIIVAYEEPNAGEFYRVVYAQSQLGNLFKSLEGSGQGFQSLKSYLNNVAPNDPRNWSTPIALDPQNVGVLYYGTHRLLRSETRGTTWEAISEQLTDWPGTGGFGTITSIAVSPTASDTILVGTDDGNVWVTPDLGNTWLDVSGGLPTRWITRVAFDPRDSKRLYVAYSGLKWADPLSHVYRSDNFGESWSDVSGNLPDAPVNALEIDPVDPDVIYVGSDVGAFVSFGRGGSWEPLGDNLPSVAVYDLEVNEEPHFILAGTHGRSMFKLDLAGKVTATEPVEVADRPTLISVPEAYPNPFTDRATLRFSLSQRANVSAEVFDVAGRKIRTLHSGTLAVGRHELRWDGHDDRGAPAANGVYLVRIYSGNGIAAVTARTVLAR